MTPYTTNEMIKPLYPCLMLVAHGPSEQSTMSGKSHAMLYSSLNFKFHLQGSRGGTVVRVLAPKSLAQVRFLDLESYEGCVCCLFLSLLQGFFLGFSSFPPSTKNQHSKFQIDMETLDKKSQLVKCPLLNPIYFIYLPISPISKFYNVKKIVPNFQVTYWRLITRFLFIMLEDC